MSCQPKFRHNFQDLELEEVEQLLLVVGVVGQLKNGGRFYSMRWTGCSNGIFYMTSYYWSLCGC